MDIMPHQYEMYWTKLPDGKYSFRRQYDDPLTLKRKRVSVTMPNASRKSRMEASLVLEEKIRQATEPRKAEDITLGELIRRYLEDDRKRNKASTAARDEGALKAVCRNIGADVIVTKITASVLKKGLGGDDVSPTTKNERLRRAKTLFRWAYANDYIESAEWLNKIKPLKEKSEREKAADKYLEASDVVKLINSMKVERWQHMTRLLVLSGMRIGEMIALLDIDVDTVNRVIHINKTYDEPRKAMTVPKTMDSIRDIYIQDELLDAIKEWRKWRKDNCASSPQFFPDYDGSVLSCRVFEKYFAENMEAVFGRRLTPHSLRHTHTSLMFEAGMPLDAISRRLGHADSRITKMIYLHCTQKKQAEYNAQIKDVRLLI